MLYIVKRTRDSHYLCPFNELKKPIEFALSPLKSDALKEPYNEAERHMHMINEILPDKYEIIQANYIE